MVKMSKKSLKNKKSMKSKCKKPMSKKMTKVKKNMKSKKMMVQKGGNCGTGLCLL